MPASTTASRTAKPTPTAVQIADALEKARERVNAEFATSTYADVTQLICKLMARYTREELKL